MNNSQKKSQHLVAKTAAVIAISAGVFFGINNSGNAATNATSTQPSVNASAKGAENESATPVFSEIVKADTISQRIRTTGDIKPMLGVSINPEAAGKIEEILVDVGDVVKKGQKLAQINDETQQAQFAQAQAALNLAKTSIESQKVAIESAKSALVSAKASVEASESQLKNLATTRKRLEKLYSEGAVSRQDVDDIIAKYDNANAAHISAQTNVKRSSDSVQTALMALEMRKAEMAQAEANLNAVKVNLEHTIVDAPFDGVITARYADPGARAEIGRALFEIEQNSPVKIIGSVSEKDLFQIAGGETEVIVKVDSLAGDFKGIIKKVYPAIDNSSRTGKIEIHMPNQDNTLRTGMFAKLDILVSTHNGAVVIPRDALVRYEGGCLTFVVENNRAVKRPIKIGIIDDNRVEVIEGLKAGERIISKGIEFIRDGALVSIE